MVNVMLSESLRSGNSTSLASPFRTAVPIEPLETVLREIPGQYFGLNRCDGARQRIVIPARGSPWEHGDERSFHSMVLDELLSPYWVLSRSQFRHPCPA